MEILKEIEDSTHFKMSIFEGRLHVKGRILTVSEVEQMGMGTSLIAHQILSANKDNVSSLDLLRDKANTEGFESLNENELNRMIDFISSIRPEQIAQLNEEKDKILCRIINQVSQDGVNWEQFRFVTAIEQQDASQNKLWIGALNREDKDSLLDKAMTGHEEAIKRVKSFQKG